MLGEKEEGKRERKKSASVVKSIETDTINRGATRYPTLCLLRRHRLR